MTSVRIACVQLRSGRDPAANLATLESLVREAAAAGALYVQTPEMTNILERSRADLFARIHRQEADPTIARMRAVAAELGVVVHLGSLAVRRPDGKLANRAVVIGRDGAIVATYDKIHMFDVDLSNGESYRESRMFRPGERAVVGDLPWGRIGLSICYDLRFPALYRALAEAGSSFVAIPAAFTRQTGEAHWHVLMRARAIENGCYVFAAAQGGLHESGRETFGHSMVVDPWGVVIAENGTEPGIVLAEIDPAAVTAARSRIPSLQHGRRFEVTEPTAVAVHLHALQEAK